MHTEIGALHSNSRIVVVTGQIPEIVPDFTLILDMGTFRGKLTLSIVCAWASDRAHWTDRNGV
jgi:hypothetical protein